MSRSIETAPGADKAVVLEDNTNGTRGLAQSSAQECARVRENGNRIEIAPVYWQAMRRAEHPEQECKLSSPLQPATFPNLIGGEPHRTPESTNAFASLPAKSDSVNAATFSKRIPTAEAHSGQARSRFAVSCGAAMIAASLACMYFREDIIAYLIQPADDADELAIVSVPQDRSLQVEQLPKSNLAPDPTVQQADLDNGSALASPALVTVGTVLTPSPKNDQRPDGLGSELSQPQEEMASNSMQYGRPLGGAQEDETTATTELRQSLQQAQDKILALENELALTRQHSEHASQSPRQSRRIVHRRLKDPGRPSFFGIFNMAPNRARLQRTTRTR
jgi:hypothetical protein